MIGDSVKYPIALNASNQELVDINKVSVNSRPHLICPECKGGFIAVINHSTPHFKHKPQTKCSGSLESYLHRVSKDVFKMIEEIEIPEITFEQLSSIEKRKLESRIEQIIDDHIPRTYQETFKRSLRKNLVDSDRFKIDKCQIEKVYNTKLGDVRIDIVCWVKNKEIFLEPYLTNNIDTIKRKKLSHLNVPTLSINLENFLIMFEDEFSIEKLKEFLMNKNSKSWVHIRNEKLNEQIDKYIRHLYEEIENHKESIIIHNSKFESIGSLKKEQERLEKIIKPYQKDLEKVMREIRRLQKELDR